MLPVYLLASAARTTEKSGLENLIDFRSPIGPPPQIRPPYIMKLRQTQLSPDGAWTDSAGELAPCDAQLVLAFGIRELLEAPELYQRVSERFPAAHVVMASTSGNLLDQMIDDSGVICTALELEKSSLRVVSGNLSAYPDLATLSRCLADELLEPDLKHIFILSDGGMVNGTVLIDAINAKLPPGATVTGGLAGDGTAFVKTVVGLNAPPSSGTIVAIGFYGAALQVGIGSSGGWTRFGPERVVTKSEGNCLHELDGKPALQLYKTYLGDQAPGLPASALRFPLSVTSPGSSGPVVRTILSIDELTHQMTFAGDIPKGAKAQLMRASYEDLIDGAQQAAQQAGQAQSGLVGAELVLCVSCVGRRIVLDQRTEEELECVREVCGEGAVLCGFYSYGELAPSRPQECCQLQNQTMTITRLCEV
jgi:hypothetical protein